MIKLEYFFRPIDFNRNSSAEPTWKDKVDRWYQLDETSMALCEAVNDWVQKSIIPKFDHLIFICASASNLADAEFVATGAISPSKFVYTLPNIGPSVVCQLLGWKGQVYCFCAEDQIEEIGLGFDQSTVSIAIDFAKNKSKLGQTVLILQTSPSLNEMGYRAVYGYYEQQSKS
ncbi:MAG: hypothetical protein WA160_15640 [Pseudobdellovibrio sp.]